MVFVFFVGLFAMTSSPLFASDANKVIAAQQAAIAKLESQTRECDHIEFFPADGNWHSLTSINSQNGWFSGIYKVTAVASTACRHGLGVFRIVSADSSPNTIAISSQTAKHVNALEPVLEMRADGPSNGLRIQIRTQTPVDRGCGERPLDVPLKIVACIKDEMPQVIRNCYQDSGRCRP